MMKKIIAFLPLFTFINIGFTQVYRDPNASISDRVEDLLNQMTLEEKIGQMTQAERGDVVYSGNEEIKTYFLGSVLSGGGSVPSPNTVDGWLTMYNQMQEKALSTRLGIPILYGVDAVHGHNNLFGSTIFPHNIGMGCTRDPELVQLCARATALEVKATGVNWTFSPCITVPQNERWGRTYEGFGESPSLVDSMAKAMVLGYQTESLGNVNSILACAKHFVGDGGTTDGEDQGNTQVTEEELRNIHLTPYYSAIEAGVGSVMASFNSWNGEKCHGNQFLLTDILKNELGFTGFVVGDWNGINQVDANFKTAIKKSINAGVDMGMQPGTFEDFITKLTELVDEGEVTEDRIDDAVRRILTVKFEMGLFENPLATVNLKDTVGCKSHRELARRAVRESVVLLKNDGIIPLSKQPGKVLVAGSKADDLGAQCGGWTITWQGALGSITEGTTIYEGVKQVIGSGNTLLTSSPTDIPDADFAIVVVGERPYAEGSGDIYSPSTFSLSSSDISMVEAVKAKGIPMVIVLLSGRPLNINSELHKSNAFIAAWLPGSEGGNGIADVIFGDYSPTGTLSHTWPASFDDIPINILGNQSGKKALFPYGYGLGYDEIGIDEESQDNDLYLYPNPTHDFIWITSKCDKNQVITICDVTGKLIQTQKMKSEKCLVPLTNFNKGVYIISCTKDGYTVSKKLVIE